MNYLVSTFYTFDGSFVQDDAATAAVGREPDETGCGIGMTADVARL
jgi:hypothetical protein